MDNMNLFKDQNEVIKERYDLAMERRREIGSEEDVGVPLRDYVHRVASFLILVDNLSEMIKDGSYSKLTFNELKSINRSLYEDITGDNYNHSYANPTYACERLGNRYGKLLSFLYTELRGTIVYAYEKQLYLHTIYLELFL